LTETRWLASSVRILGEDVISAENPWAGWPQLAKCTEILGISGTQKGVSRGFSEFLVPNLSAQMSKLWQDREWLLRDENRFCQLNDAIRRSVPEELRCLSQVVHAQRIETH